MKSPPVGDPWVKSAEVSATEGDTSDSRGTGIGPPGPAQGTWCGLEILEEIGQGGFGRVYRAWEPTLAREVALKIIRPPEGQPAAVNAILREGQLLARVHHRNVVTIHGAQQIGNEIGLWMEFVRGRTLTDIVKHDGPRAAGEAALIGVTLCQALAAVHQTGVVHRDIKAHNVMREAGGRIVLMDFGAGQVLTEPGDAHPIGTPVYMAPEVLAGSRATARSDIYSLGVLLFYLVTGDYPVEGRTWTDFLIAHARSDRRHLADVRPDLPPRFVRVVERATMGSPDERYATPGAMLRELADTATGEESAPAGRPTPPRVDSPGVTWTEPVIASHAWRTASVIAAVVLGIGALGAIATAGYNTSLARTGEFADEPLLASWRWGLKSLVAGSMQIAIVMMAWWLVRSVWNLLARAVPLLMRFSEVLQTARATLARRTGLRNPSTAAHTLLTAQILAIFAFCWYFGDILSAAFTVLESASPQDVEALRPEHLERHQLFNLTMAMIVLGMSLGTRQVIKLRRRAGDTAGRGLLIANIGLVAVALAIVVLPYRLIWHNRAEVVTYESMRCYAVGEGRADVLVYCPSSAVPKIRVTSRTDPHLQRSRVIESIYTR